MATRSSSSNRSHGKFATKCGCLNHEIFNESSSPLLYLAKNVSRRLSYKVLMERNLLTRRNKHVCKDCLAYAQKHFVRSYALESSFSELNVTKGDSFELNTNSLSETCSDIDLDDSVLPDHSCDSSNLSETDKPADDLGNIIEILKSINSWSKLNENCRQKVCERAKILGSLINADIYENTKSANNDYKNLDVDKHHWIKACNPLLVNFLQSATGCKDIKDNEKKTKAFTHLLEQAHYARNLKYVSPFAFQRNVVSYSLSNSKVCTNLTGHWESSGCYSTVHDFICSPADPISCPEGNVHIAIDNNQKIGKLSGRICEGSKVPMDICTSISNFLVNANSPIQNSESLAPSAWQDISDDAFSNIIPKVNEYENGYQDVFRTYRNQYISEVITEVKNDQSNTRETDFRDHVDTSLRQYEMGASNHVCIQCNYVYSTNRQSQCPQCKRDPKYNPIGYDPYFRTPSKHVDILPIISVGEPCMVNPNNEERLKQVLCQLRAICITPIERYWVIVWSDGIPYLYGMRLQQNIYICASCGEHVDIRKESLTDHASKPHHDPNNFNVFSRAFGDFIFRPGPGHIELNMARCLLNFCWPVLLPIVNSFGFRTKKAQDVIKRGADHHRSKSILLTLFKALARELIVPYIRLSLQQGYEMSVESFYTWVSDSVVDPNYLYLFDMCFTFLLSLKMYNEGVRKNHHEVMMASRLLFASLFFAGRHPKYQELHVHDLCDRVQYPDDLTTEMNKTESFSVSGETNSGQGADFVHEEKYKFIKSFLPPGVPNSEIWQRVSRKSEMLKQLKGQCCGELSQPCKSRTSRFDIEQLMMQRHLRTCLSSPCLSKPHKSLNGEPLDKLLHSIKSVGRRNYAAYKENLSKIGKFGGVKLENVFISAESRIEHEKIENKTRAEILAQIRNIITVMPNETVQFSYMSQINNLKTSVKKPSLIELYYEVSLDLEDQLAGEIIPDESEEIEL